MDLLTDKPTKDQISDERSQILKEHSIYSAWRARNLQDARKMGILNGERFIESRDRLTVALNGQVNAEKVLIGLMKSSLFVEEAKKSLTSRTQAAGLSGWKEEIFPERCWKKCSRNQFQAWWDRLLTNLFLFSEVI